MYSNVGASAFDAAAAPPAGVLAGRKSKRSCVPAPYWRSRSSGGAAARSAWESGKLRATHAPNRLLLLDWLD